jgi:hypothetical protein
VLRWQTITGVLIGLVLGAAILSLANGGRRQPPPSGAILSECDGHFRELVIQYEPSAKEIVSTPYSQFLGALESDVTVFVVCPSRAAYDELAGLVGKVRCKLKPIIVNHPMTTWSRDRWVALAPASPNGVTTLLSQPEEVAAGIWPARAGDERIGADIARTLPLSVFSRRASFYFDGGDFLADNESVFVAPRVLLRNIQRTEFTQDAFVCDVSNALKRHVVLFDEAPDHHVAMFMASVGNKTVLVGDPKSGRSYLTNTAAADFAELPGGPDFTAQTQQRFDAVAAQCAQAGYRVIRVPAIPAADGRSYLTYVNCLIDRQGDRRIVYLPFYRGATALNDAARKIWKDLGFEIRPVDCTTTYRQFGCLHCLVNVLTRF